MIKNHIYDKRKIPDIIIDQKYKGKIIPISDIITKNKPKNKIL